MSFKLLTVASLALVAFAATPAAAQTVSGQLQVTGQAAGEAFEVIAPDIDTYVRANVVDDVTFATAPEVGVIVEDTVTLVPVEGFDAYSYTYFEGRPVIVQNDTRAIVSLGD